MKEEIGVEERLFRKSDKPSEDLSCNWHYKRSPSYNDSASTDATGKWCIFVSPTEVDEVWSKISGASELLESNTSAVRYKAPQETLRRIILHGDDAEYRYARSSRVYCGEQIPIENFASRAPVGWCPTR